MKTTDTDSGNKFSQIIGEKVTRKLKTENEPKQSDWIGLGMFGMIGWSVAVPTLIGTALGIWLDKKHAQSFSWTLTFLIAGLFGGCLMAGYWVSKENKDMHQD
jgi:ATP synthase protein I